MLDHLLQMLPGILKALVLLAVCLLTACAAPAIGAEKMEQPMEMRYRLSNPNADVTTQEVYRFLCSLFGDPAAAGFPDHYDCGALSGH